LESPKIKIQAVRAPAVSPVDQAHVLVALLAPAGVQARWADPEPMARLVALAAQASQTARWAAQAAHPVLAQRARLAAVICLRAARLKPPLRSALWVANVPALRASKKMVV
jgi:hypothetical protein